MADASGVAIHRSERHGGCRHRGHVETSEGAWHTPGLLTREPVAREARHDATANERNQQDDGGNARSHRKIGAASEMRFEMKGDIARGENADDRDDFQIAPVFSRHDFARGGGDNEQQERAVDRSRRAPADQGRQPNRRAPGDPDREQRQERPTLDRQASRPVWNGRQKEARHDGRHEAVEHLVDMPVARSKPRGEFELAVEHGQPGKNRKPGIERAEQEEGAKAIGKKGRPLVVTEARNAGHVLLPL